MVHCNKIDPFLFQRITEVYETKNKIEILDHVRSLILDMICEDLEGKMFHA